MAISNAIKSFITTFFEYDTAKIVHIKNKKVGTFNRIVQLIIICYIIGIAIIWNKGYQESDNVQSSVVTKVKGIASTNQENISRIWDVADYIIPPQENGAFFVMTNVLITPNQTMGDCPEDWSNTDAQCHGDPEHCVQYTGSVLPKGNGVATGKCVNITDEEEEEYKGQVCEVFAWCPTERDSKIYSKKKRIHLETRNFTVMIKNSIQFPRFKVKRRNIFEDQQTDCIYDPVTNPYCAIFQLDTIIKLSNEDYDKAAAEGSVFLITIKWDCNLDYSTKYCKPKYSFSRIDTAEEFAKGWNFRYADHYAEDGVNFRTLYKAFGIRFIVNVEGKAGKFNIVNLALNLGAGIALLSIATVATDILCLYFVQKRNIYYERKYSSVKEEDYQEFVNKTAENYGT